MIKRVGEIGIIILIVTNTFELGFSFAIHRRASLYGRSDGFPLPSGYLLDKRYYIPSSAAPCHLIRIYAKGCQYCLLDKPLYAQLAQQAEKVGCEMVVIAPRAKEAELYNDSRVVQLQYIDMKFGQALNPFITPQTILLDGSGRVVRFEKGAMDNSSVAHAIDALHKLR